MSIEQLRNLMQIPYDASAEEIKQRFDKIAQILINHAYIQRGEKQFFIDEIEFYYFSKKHPDLITYPRNTSALQWYRNSFFGVDLTFESHIETEFVDGDLCFTLQKGNPSFGGILFRKLSDNEVIDGPRLCANKLFGVLDATQHPKDYPILKIDESTDRARSICKAARTKIVSKTDDDTITKRVKSILWNNWYKEEVNIDLIDSFKTYIDAEYKYFAK
jgi:hypothetical protein